MNYLNYIKKISTKVIKSSPAIILGAIIFPPFINLKCGNFTGKWYNKYFIVCGGIFGYMIANKMLNENDWKNILELPKNNNNKQITYTQSYKFKPITRSIISRPMYFDGRVWTPGYYH